MHDIKQSSVILERNMTKALVFVCPREIFGKMTTRVVYERVELIKPRHFAILKTVTMNGIQLMNKI